MIQSSGYHLSLTHGTRNKSLFWDKTLFHIAQGPPISVFWEPWETLEDLADYHEACCSHGFGTSLQNPCRTEMLLFLYTATFPTFSLFLKRDPKH